MINVTPLTKDSFSMAPKMWSTFLHHEVDEWSVSNGLEKIFPFLHVVAKRSIDNKSVHSNSREYVSMEMSREIFHWYERERERERRKKGRVHSENPEGLEDIVKYLLYLSSSRIKSNKFPIIALLHKYTERVIV